MAYMETWQSVTSAISQVGVTGLFSILKDLIVSVATIITAIVAVKGIRTWRDQLRGTSKHQVARRVLNALYALQDAILEGRETFKAAAKVRWAVHTGKPTSDYFRSGEPLGIAKRAMGRIWAAHSDLVKARLDARTIWGEKAMAILESVFTQYMLVNMNYMFQFESNPDLSPPEPPKSGTALFPDDDVLEDEYERGLRKAVTTAAEFFHAQV